MTIYWVNFRYDVGGPSGFAGDGANSVYNLGDAYPFTGHEIGGVYPQGWGADNHALGADQKTDFAAFEHQAGRCSATASIDQCTFRIGGLTTGRTYKIYASLGAIDTTINNGFTVYKDNRTNSVHSVAGGSVAAGSFMDATGAIYVGVSGGSGWAANQVGVTLPTATTTDLYFSKSGNNAYFNAIGIEDVTSVAAAGGSTLLTMGV